MSKRCPSLSELPPPPPGRVGWPWTEESPRLPDAMPDGRPWPAISIVTPSYNQAAFIEETLRSVLLQGYPALDYVVMDGGSNDGSQAVIERYAPFLSGFVSERDGGQPDALITGFARSRGERCGWLCADDLLLPHCLRRVAERCPPGGWLVGSSRVIDVAGNPTATVLHSRYRRGDVLYNTYILNQVSVFWSAALYRRVRGLDRELFYCMDYDLWTQFEHERAPVVIADVLGAFRVHPDAKTAAGDRSWAEIFQTRARNLRGHPLARAAHRASWTLRALLGRAGIGAGVGHGFGGPAG